MIEPFDGEDFADYSERLNTYFIANNIGQVAADANDATKLAADKKKVAVNISVIGKKAYSTIKDLCLPDLPADKTYEQLTEILNNFYKPKALVKERNVIDVVQRSTSLTNAAMFVLLVIAVTSVVSTTADDIIQQYPYYVIFQESGLKLKRDKFHFMMNEIVYLGFSIAAAGVSPTKEKVQAIQDAAPPTNVAELQSFIGAANFLHTVLRHYDPAIELVLQCDSSSMGVGAALLQPDPDGMLQPVAYASRTLNKAEKNLLTN
ncbi:hypothetical protein QZH41_005780 [Actinostola sp. cb2023]|nr:hypothetical protein QZH41_005780 [Actinostola sp. cb2023]